jgi:hypothetical protein
MVFYNFPVALCLEAPVLPSASWFRRLILLFAGQVIVMEVSEWSSNGHPCTNFQGLFLGANLAWKSTFNGVLFFGTLQ